MMLRKIAKTLLPLSVRNRLKRVGPALLRAWERIKGGGRVRGWLLTRLLEQHYRCRLRREWSLGAEPPHFTDHRLVGFLFTHSKNCAGPGGFFRGFHVAELLRPTDDVLDIGCGDGFFTRRYFAPRCRSVDAVDIEPTAVAAARANNSAPNVRYHFGDAVAEPPPRERYDVVVWDGALGHFAPETVDRMIDRIAAVLADDGVFCGSESLGHEGTDHLQWFDTAEQVGKIFRRRFAHVELKTAVYGVEFVRTEVYWRCSNRPDRLSAARWVPMEG